MEGGIKKMDTVLKKFEKGERYNFQYYLDCEFGFTVPDENMLPLGLKYFLSKYHESILQKEFEKQIKKYLSKKKDLTSLEKKDKVCSLAFVLGGREYVEKYFDKVFIKKIT